MIIKDIRDKIQKGTTFWIKVVVAENPDSRDYANAHYHIEKPTSPISSLFCADIYADCEIKDVENLCETEEMTLEQICLKLGKNIKIVQ